jgi:hypothetical protein
VSHRPLHEGRSNRRQYSVAQLWKEVPAPFRAEVEQTPDWSDRIFSTLISTCFYVGLEHLTTSEVAKSAVSTIAKYVVAIVTGASSWIGQANAIRPAAAGAHPFLIARRVDRLAGLAERF